MSEAEEFLRFCGQMVFGDAVSVWERLTPKQQTQFCIEAQKSNLEMLFVRYLGERLPQEFYPAFRKRYQAESLNRMIESRNLAGFYQIWEAAKIPFVPIKGADLAFRIYPDQTLRPHGDWDVMFRDEDCPEVFRLLQKNGWRTSSGYAPQTTSLHHYEPLHKGRYTIEVHRTLPRFGNASAEEIWQESSPVSEYHRVLAPEMNLLLIATHAAGNQYAHVSHVKILLDAAMILKHDAVDWKKVHQLADRWKILRPDVLLHVWNDFFPDGVLPPEEPSSETQRLVREIFASREVWQERSAYEKKLADKTSFQWLRTQLKFYNPVSICLKYHLSSHQKGKILVYGIRDFLEKAWFFLTHWRRKDSRLQAYQQNVARLEALIKREK